LTEIDAIRRVCGLCVEARSHGPVCMLHLRDYASLPPDCAVCVEDMSKVRRRSHEDAEMIDSVREAIALIERYKQVSRLIPEIGMNITYAKQDAQSTADVVGIPGRIHPIAGYPRSSRPPAFGGSSHVARATLAMMSLQPSLRSSMSLRYDADVIEECERLGLAVSGFDRREEPADVRNVEGTTIPWGIRRAFSSSKSPPSVVYDSGGIGKEPMIFLFGTNPMEVAQIAVELATRAKR